MSSEVLAGGWMAKTAEGNTIAYTPVSAVAAGTAITINGNVYIAKRDIAAGRLGVLTKLRERPHWIVPKKVGDTFANRAAVYLDAVAADNSCTSTVGSNVLVGYAVANTDFGTGTSGAYASADTYMEIESDYVTTTTSNQTGQATNLIADPGTGANVVVTAGGTCELTIAAAGETRGVPAPTFDGQRMMLTIKGFTTSATAKVALGAAYNATPSGTVDGTNKFVTFNAFGQGCLLEAIPLTASTYKWMLIANLGGTLAAS
jgi:predicted RecA/RadA family phage recombinase